jgi:hypothetical protein
MRANYIPVSTQRRIEALEARHSGAGTRPVAMLPAVQELTTWGAVAEQAQWILKENIKCDTAPDYGELITFGLLPH